MQTYSLFRRHGRLPWHEESRQVRLHLVTLHDDLHVCPATYHRLCCSRVVHRDNVIPTNKLGLEDLWLCSVHTHTSICFYFQGLLLPIPANHWRLFCSHSPPYLTRLFWISVMSSDRGVHLIWLGKNFIRRQQTILLTESWLSFQIKMLNYTLTDFTDHDNNATKKNTPLIK